MIQFLWIIGWSTIFAPLVLSLAIVDTSIACDKTDFLLKIKFDDVFRGTIQSRSGSPKCIYANGTLQPDTKYQLKIPLKGCSTKENGEGNLENEIEVVMANNNEFNAETDKRFLLTCIPAAPVPKESQVTVSFGGITINSDATTASSLLNNQTVDYRVRVLDGASLDAKQLQRPLAVEDKVVWGDFEVSRRNGKTIFYNHIKAWAFPTSNEVNIFCNLHVCVTCSQPTCRGRERRHHSSESPIADPFTSSIDVSDISPPIAVRTSFRLKRENQNQARLETSPSAVSTSSSSANHVFFLLVLLIAASGVFAF
ncbi:Protein CBG05129 [Caenorhabditis briggsae]|uniref:Protein CBG05129 n=1 Tax=Caenorhabditis briggsae TaxID=6238 RepID=A8WZ71_CAEBR|nr:Protein CBG05129 [Caenorhabditis briggsae]CAP25681.2 Protein CBG05129 [Caenorhabditis briggsae]